MAKWGEGDPRWIVEERADAKNVNNWHWTEKDCTTWSKAYLERMLLGLKVVDEEDNDGYTYSLEKLDLEGDVTMGNRKSKIYYIYDLELRLSWEGEQLEGEKKDEKKKKGRIVIKDISHDNDVDEFNYIFEKDEASSGSNLDEHLEHSTKRVLRHDLLEKIKHVLKQFPLDLKETHGKNILLPTKSAESEIKKAHDSKPNQSNQEPVHTAATAIPSPVNLSTHKLSSIKMNIHFNAALEHLMRVFIQPDAVKAWAGSDATIQPKVNTHFSLFGGTISGEITCLSSNCIVQSWRLASWPVNHFSKVELTFEADDDGTRVSLVQTGIPTADVDSIQRNWHEYYFKRIKAIFGFGLPNL